MKALLSLISIITFLIATVAFVGGDSDTLMVCVKFGAIVFAVGTVIAFIGKAFSKADKSNEKTYDDNENERKP